MLAFQGLFLFAACSLELKNGRDESCEATGIETILGFADNVWRSEVERALAFAVILIGRAITFGVKLAKI